jgi:hypothetical protein
MAKIPEEMVRRVMATCADRQKELTSAGVLRAFKAEERGGAKADDWDYDEKGYYREEDVRDAYKKLWTAADRFLDDGHEEYQHLRLIVVDRRHIDREEVDNLLIIFHGLRRRVERTIRKLKDRKEQPRTTHVGPTLLSTPREHERAKERQRAKAGEEQET